MESPDEVVERSRSTGGGDDGRQRRHGPVIEVFADVWCPFAHVGLRTILAYRERAGREDVAVLVRAWPLELVNGAPLDPAVTKRHAEELREQVATDLFGDLDVHHFPTSTLEALALTHRAYRVGLRAGEHMSVALRDALFEEGRDVADPTVLEAIAGDLGVPMPDGTDRAAVATDLDEGRRRGVLGSPHFFCGSADVFCPTLDITKDPVAGLSVVRDAARLTAFLDRCLDRPGRG